MRLGWSRMPSRGVSADLTGGASANLTADCFLQSPPQLRNTNTKQEAKSKPNIQKTSSSQPTHYSIMPPVRTARASRKAPPEGFDDIEDTLLEFQTKMKDAENASHEGKKKYEMTWPIFQITHQRSRYIYDLYYTKEAISKQLYDYLLKNGYADPMLIAKWKKQGYEKVSCLNYWYKECGLTQLSYAARAASRQKKPTSGLPAYAASREISLKRIRRLNVSTVAVEDALRVIERRQDFKIPRYHYSYERVSRIGRTSQDLLKGLTTADRYPSYWATHS